MRKMPQIPRDVFFGEPAAAPTPEPPPTPVGEPIPAPLAPPPPAQAVPPTPSPAPVPVEEDKVQVTVYLSPQIAKHLEGLRFHLLTDHNVKVSKSAIAEYAIGRLGGDLSELALFFAVGER